MFRISAAVGIDISHKHVRVAFIEKRADSITLKSLISIASNGAALETVMARIKKELAKASKLPWFFVSHQILGVSQSSVAVKRFPALKEPNDQEQYIQAGLQLSDSLGLSLDELLYDYRPVDETNGIEVFACRRSQIESTLNALETTGFRLTAIEIQTFALMRLFQQFLIYQSVVGASLLVDVGLERVHLCIHDGHQGQFYRELPLPLEGHYPSTAQEKHQFTEQLADGILRHYQLSGLNLTHDKIKNLWLSGESAKMIDPLLLEQKLNWNVAMFNPLTGLSYSPALIDELYDPVGAWATAIGLALRDI